MRFLVCQRFFLPLIVLVSLAQARAEEQAVSDYQKTIQPILVRYCTGCHNNQEMEGELSLDSYASLQKGGAEGPIVKAGVPKESRLIEMLTGSDELMMPPEDEEKRPTQKEIETLIRWVRGGAPGPKDGLAGGKDLVVPKLTPSSAPGPVTAVATSADGKYLAVARFQNVDLLDAATRKRVHQLKGHAGKINDLRFTADSSELIVASGIAGLYGEVRLWDVASGKPIRTFSGHDDTIYAAVASWDKQVLATGGYDQKIILWDFASGEKQRVLKGHNGAVFDLAFSPDGHNLVSASGDATVKVWHVPTGKRLDTRSEPLKEQYSVDFSPNGLQFAAGGADNRLRVWKFVSKDEMKINPILHARFGHEGSIARLRYSADGNQLVTAALDQSIKVWQNPELKQQTVYQQQPDSIEALAVDSVNGKIFVGRMDGSLGAFELPAPAAQSSTSPETKKGAPAEDVLQPAGREPEEVAEIEPNDGLEEAQPLSPPVTITGVIRRENIDEADEDVDQYRFHARAGESWVFEIDAARSDSPLDSIIQIVDSDGQSVPRLFLQAVRDSYFTYRGKNSNQIDDFRLHNWREMRLNQYLYANGEVVRLYHYPRGPDSGFKVYPNFDERFGFFETTPVTHSLGEVCYIVEPHESADTIVPNGLPVFPVYYENDDDSQRQLGKDSRLTFTAPRDGDYLARVRDVRRFGGEEYKYKLHVRPQRPDFKLRISRDLTVPIGGLRRIDMKLNRIDGFDGPVSVAITGLPHGFSIAGPIAIESGQHRASATIRAAKDAPEPTEENLKNTKVTATATINGQQITHDIGSFNEIKLGEKPKLSISIEPGNEALESEGLPVLIIPAGKTIKCKLLVERNDHAGVIEFGHEEAAWNLPHGVYVDNIGLNGVLMLANENEREVFITAEPGVAENERPIFFEATIDGRPASSPVMLRVTPADS